MYSRTSLFVASTLMLSACAASGSPENVSTAFDGTYVGAAEPTAGPCTSNPDYDVTMNIDDGAISGSASNGEYDFNLDGYVTEGGNLDGSFVPSGASSRSVGDIEGRVTEAGKVNGNWEVGLGSGCSGSLSLASKS